MKHHLADTKSCLIRIIDLHAKEINILIPKLIILPKLNLKFKKNFIDSSSNYTVYEDSTFVAILF